MSDPHPSVMYQNGHMDTFACIAEVTDTTVPTSDRFHVCSERLMPLLEFLERQRPASAKVKYPSTLTPTYRGPITYNVTPTPLSTISQAGAQGASHFQGEATHRGYVNDIDEAGNARRKIQPSSSTIEKSYVPVYRPRY